MSGQWYVCFLNVMQIGTEERFSLKVSVFGQVFNSVVVVKVRMSMLICPYSSGSDSLITWSIHYNKWAAKSIPLETEKIFFLNATQSTSCQMFI